MCASRSFARRESEIRETHKCFKNKISEISNTLTFYNKRTKYDLLHVACNFV